MTYLRIWFDGAIYNIYVSLYSYFFISLSLSLYIYIYIYTHGFSWGLRICGRKMPIFRARREKLGKTSPRKFEKVPFSQNDYKSEQKYCKTNMFMFLAFHIGFYFKITKNQYKYIYIYRERERNTLIYIFSSYYFTILLCYYLNIIIDS